MLIVGRGGSHSQINATDFRHAWLTGLELNISALCADVDTTVDSSCLSPHNHESYESQGVAWIHYVFPKQTTVADHGPLHALYVFQT